LVLVLVLVRDADAGAVMLVLVRDAGARWLMLSARCVVLGTLC
jgi:hypothetical protein